MKSSHEVLHKQPIFILICSITVLLTITSFSIICYQLELKLTLDDLKSYSNIDKVIYIPKLIASSGFAILAFYALWFRISQTSVQIKNQENQLKELRTNNKADQLISELDKISDRIFEMIQKKERTTTLVIKQIILEEAKKNNAQESGFVHDYSNELTVITFDDKHKFNLEWDGTILNLNVYLKNNEKINPKVDFKKIYKDYDESYKSKHRTIASQLKMLLVVAMKLSEVDGSHYSYIRNVLSLYLKILLVLEKVGLIEPHYTLMYRTLQDLERPKSSLKINLPRIYLQEMKDDGIIDQEESLESLNFEVNRIESSDDAIIVYEIKFENKIYIRKNGEYLSK